ncbi:MAG: hypothetical protein RR313_11005 [Anaerovoracaceae bacterium]
MADFGIDVINAITFDEPVIYKGLKLYQCTLKDYLIFKSAQDSLSLNRAYEKDLELLQLPYLEYVYRKSQTSQESYQIWCMLNCVLSISFATDKFEYSYDCDGFKLSVTQDDNTFLFTCQEFDEIKELICQINDIVVEDIDPEWEKQLKDAQKKLATIRDNSGVEFRDMLTAFGVNIGKLPNEMKNISVPTFERYTKMYLDKDEYKINHSAEMSGMVTFKQKIEHWLSHYRPKGKYDNVVSNRVKENILDKL